MASDWAARFEAQVQAEVEFEMLDRGIPFEEVPRRRALANHAHDAAEELAEAADKAATDLGEVLEGLQDEEDPAHREHLERAWRKFAEALGDIRVFLGEPR